MELDWILCSSWTEEQELSLDQEDRAEEPDINLKKQARKLSPKTITPLKTIWPMTSRVLKPRGFEIERWRRFIWIAPQSTYPALRTAPQPAEDVRVSYTNEDILLAGNSWNVDDRRLSSAVELLLSFKTSTWVRLTIAVGKAECVLRKYFSWTRPGFAGQKSSGMSYTSNPAGKHALAQRTGNQESSRIFRKDLDLNDSIILRAQSSTFSRANSEESRRVVFSIVNPQTRRGEYLGAGKLTSLWFHWLQWKWNIIVSDQWPSYRLLTICESTAHINN